MKRPLLKFIGIVLVITFIYSMGFIHGDESVELDKSYLTRTVQAQYFEIDDLNQRLSVCNWEVGNTQTIELIAPVTRGMVE